MRQVELRTELLRGRVAVLFGGDSAEREVSLESGAAVHAALARRLPDVLAIDARSDVLEQLMRENIKHVFIALHGAEGENGTLQGALEMMGISYTGSGVLACALAMDKLRCKRFWQSSAIPTPAFAVVSRASDYHDVCALVGPRLFLKPASEGSSIGIMPADSAEEFVKAVELASRFDSVVLAERLVAGPEYTVAIVDGEVMPSICLETDNRFYDYEAKYKSDETRYRCPSGLSADDEKTIGEIALAAFDSLGCKGWGRVDIMREASNDEFLVLEVNTSPGMTSHSLVPMAAKAVDMDFENLVVTIFNASLQEAAG